MQKYYMILNYMLIKANEIFMSVQLDFFVKKYKFYPYIFNFLST